MKKSCLVFLIQVLTAGIVLSQAPLQPVVLQWEKPYQVAVSEDQVEEVIYFDGAIFKDSLQSIPYFIYRSNVSIPFFRKTYSISSSEFIPVEPTEQRILESSGFRSEDIELYPGTEFIEKEQSSFVGLYPFRLNPVTGQYEKLLSFTLESQHVYDGALKYDARQSYSPNSVLAQGSWYKVCVDQTGIYRLGFDELTKLGVSVSGLQKQNLRLFGNGSGMLPEANDAARYDDLLENAIFVSGNSSDVFGSSDYILFYGRSPHQWYFDSSQGTFNHEVHLYSNENCYYLTTDQGAGKRVSARESTSSQPSHTVNTFQDYAWHQRDLETLLNSGQVWYGEVFDATLSRVFNFPFADIDPTGPARIKTYLAARSSSPSSFSVQAGSSQMTANVFSINPAAYEGYFARYTMDSLWFTPNQAGNVAVTINYNRTSSGSKGWLNFIALNVTRHLRFSGSQMSFRNVSTIGQGNIAQYNLGNAAGNITVWDVTDRFNIKIQQTIASAGSLGFRVAADTLREFVAFNGSSFLAPRLSGKIANQNLHALQTHDLIIVSPEQFLEQAQRLADFRQTNDGLSVAIVTPRQIYNEFSSGTADVSAIRNFMKMFYDRAQTPEHYPRYLLLFGNGTVDNKDNLGFGGNLIPTFQTKQSLTPSGGFENGVSVDGTHMTDDYFGLLDDTEGKDARGVIDIGIGRLPVRTLEEATIMVDKILRYDNRVPGMDPFSDNLEFVGSISNYADWRNMVVLIADDGDNNIHFNHTESLASYMEQNHQVYNLDKIYLDAYNQVTSSGGSRYPDVNQAINDRVNKGALMINYIGHGGTQGLAHERILTFDDITTWNNFYNMPIIMTATCEFSSFDQPDPDNLSAGVRITLKPDGGAIALYTTTRLAWSSSNLTLNTRFLQNAFIRNDKGQFPRLGDMIRIAKQQSSSGGTLSWRLRNFVLLGDPSMQMAYPQMNVVTHNMPDTIMAFQEVTVTGHVADDSGNKISDYNGVVFATIYDKNIQFRTQGHDPGSHPANFQMRNALLHKGKSLVTDGEFAFTFVVPHDISYNFGGGKISYYLDNGQIDGRGYSDSFTIGGTLDGFEADNTGPGIRLFINDTAFVSGGLTNENPILLAFLQDANGINITGRIGHDIVAFFNHDASRSLVLNDYYQADLDTYQKGKVVYPFFNLADGPHTLSLRVWDIHNNASQEDIEFIVQSSAQLALVDLLNYPNPFSLSTHFVFSHNQAFQEMDIRIDIFDMSGRLLQTLHSQGHSAGYRSQPIEWDGSDISGKPLGNGVYVYRLTLSGPGGGTSQQTEKLVILR